MCVKFLRHLTELLGNRSRTKRSVQRAFESNSIEFFRTQTCNYRYFFDKQLIKAGKLHVLVLV